MGFDDVAAACTAELGLSLGCHHKLQHAGNHERQSQNSKKPLLRNDQLLPSDLTLGPSDEAESIRGSSSSPSGAVSSSSFKPVVDRDLLLGSCEEAERVISEELYEDQAAGSSPRKKLRLTKQQSATLEDCFKQHTTLNPKQKLELARNLNLRPRQVEVWFQNRRARTKLKQTEADCELLRKCCETLKEENKRLHKELQELQLMEKPSPTTTPSPCYLQFPMATLTVCSSCSERMGNAAGDDHHHHDISKPHLFN